MDDIQRLLDWINAMPPMTTIRGKAYETVIKSVLDPIVEELEEDEDHW